MFCRVRDLIDNCTQHFLELGLKIALQEEPKHVAVKNYLIIF